MCVCVHFTFCDAIILIQVRSLKIVEQSDLEQLSFFNPLRFIGMSAADLEDVEQVLWVDEAGAFAIAGCRVAT